MTRCGDSPAATAVAERLLSSAPPRATSFIVTIYGDVVEPRGNVLWMGTLIECCGRCGISESLVRTAVSRLVAAGRLEGERIGRRSYYRLSPAAQEEFREAGRVLFSPPELPREWVIVLGADEVSTGWAPLGPDAMIAPRRPGRPLPRGAVLRARHLPGIGDLTAFAARHWPMAEVAARYGAFLDRFAALEADAGEVVLEDADALTLRLRLVDEYRQAALADPRLPLEATPADWPAAAARDVFRRIYLMLSPGADRRIGSSFADSAGLLPECTPEILRRRQALQAG